MESLNPTATILAEMPNTNLPEAEIVVCVFLVLEDEFSQWSPIGVKQGTLLILDPYGSLHMVRHTFLRSQLAWHSLHNILLPWRLGGKVQPYSHMKNISIRLSIIER